MSSSSCALILGARGRFGLAASRAFAQAGWKVYAQVRPGGSGPAIAGVQWLAAQPGDTAALAAAARGAEVVVQGLSPVYTHKAWAADMPRLTQAAIDVSRQLGATSGTGSWLDLVMARQLRQGKFTYPGALDVPTTWAYLPDMARSFVEIAEQRHRLPAFETLHFGGLQLTGQDWADAVAPIAREQGWVKPEAHLRAASVSWTLMRVLGLFVPTVAALCEMRYLWRTPYALANARLVALIGEEPHTPFPQALRKALDDLGMLAPQGSASGQVSLSLR